jgi:dienelactone hydrolase
MRRLGLAALVALAAAAPADAAPVVGAEVPAGSGIVVSLADQPAPPRTLDGDSSDWPGTLPPFAGALQYSHGTLAYRDHITDAYGADNGQDADRLGLTDPATAVAPDLYRLEPAYQYVPGEFGVPTGPLDPQVHYGDLPHADEADLSEVRLGTDGERNLWLLARTTTMKDAGPGTALLVLLDTTPGNTARPVPYNSGLTTATGDVAVYLAGDGGSWTDLATGATHPLSSVRTNAAGYTNTIEAAIPAAALAGARDQVGVAVAAGLADSGKLKTLALQPNVANVAFRTTEPTRDWWDKQQGLELYKGTIDRFFTTAHLGRMERGASERYVPGPGYHDRVFESDPRISREQGDDGVLQHYGVYLPEGYRQGTPAPVQWWFHFRGGNAHIAAAVVPGIFRDMGAAQDSVVVTPDGRGTSGWYVGKSHLDYREVHRDVHRLLTLDRDREYIAGHSMGGWASYLLPVLYPDRFAASFPASGPPTQGMWAGCEGNPCYQGANGGDARAQLTTPLLGNLRHVPVAIYHGTEDELVPVSGVVAQAERLRALGLRYRLYLFPHQEHYGPPIQDEWTEGAAYEHRFARDRNPGRVTYTRSMRFERAVNTVNNDEKVDFGFEFKRAYWMSGLEPVDAENGVAAFDGTTLARPEAPRALLPEAGGPAALGQTGPYTMVGQKWRPNRAARPAPRNGFTITLSGAGAVVLDLERMGIDARRSFFGRIDTQAPLTLRLRGPVDRSLRATLDGEHIDADRTGPGVTVTVPAGEHRLELG